MSTFIYVYGLIPSQELEYISLPSFEGMDGVHAVYALPCDTITAVVCELDAGEYAEDVLQERMNTNLAWLQEKAMRHHEMLLALDRKYTLIPMKLFTIHKSKSSLELKIENVREEIGQLFAKLQNSQEWNVKIYCNDSMLRENVMQHDPVIAAKEEEISQLSPGRQFFEKKKLDQWVERHLEENKTQFCAQFHEELKRFALADTVKRNWSKEATGRQDNMSWNSVYLLQDERIDNFLTDIREKKASFAEDGWTIEVSGPWPAYHFAELSGKGELVT
ncbi:GvpL/GvpF family gas vesicle protein [Bacillus horti]|uniref:GvpL/GvpF family gas vesicle protein n=1 Tax=Caldalkalibacillus horti TaxID=77523 RepID=A0ABT9W072_9BACI|nr:GvpL/GvpF family gas vesicle protein [Bacillus horti]MDQ0166490.1 hypothetical protein [Bacillus horti]